MKLYTAILGCIPNLRFLDYFNLEHEHNLKFDQSMKILSLALIIAALIASVGKAIDGLLLSRHVSALDAISIRAWLYLDRVTLRNIPRSGLRLFILLKEFLFGRGMGLEFIFRVILVSAMVTAIAMPFGRAIGMYLMLVCEYASGNLDPANLATFGYLFQSALGFFTNDDYLWLAATNITFDFLTISITTVLIGCAIRKNSIHLTAFVALDIVLCVVLFHALMWSIDQFDIASRLTNTDSVLDLIPTIIFLAAQGCSSFHFLTSKLLFSSTVLLPTLIYLSIILLLALFRHGFLLSRWIGMHLLERSSEDERRSIIGHLATTLGVLVAMIGAALEAIGVAAGA